MRARSGFFLAVLFGGCLWLGHLDSAGAQITPFTYQGRLLEQGTARDGACDFEFRLFDAPSGGNQLGEPHVSNQVGVSDGLFTTTVDFGFAFTGAPTWLAVAVRCPAGQGSFTALSPRQPVAAAPNALWAPMYAYDEGGFVVVASDFTDEQAGFLETYGPNGELNASLSHFADSPDEGLISVHDADGLATVQIFTSGGGAGAVETYGFLGETNVLISNLVDFPDHGFIGVYDEGEIAAGMYVTENHRSLVFADEKDFVVDHPARPGHKIVYTSLEGPEAAIYHRGAVDLRDGRGAIELPDHFTALANPATITVQLTPHSLDSQGVAVGSIDAGRIEIGELRGGKGSYEVYYVVHALRRGYEERKTVMSAAEFHSTFPVPRLQAQKRPAAEVAAAGGAAEAPRGPAPARR
jgi:hypothetical protein